MKWAMVGIIVGATALADVLQSFEMKRHAVAVNELRPERLGANAARTSRAAAAGCWLCS